MLIKSTLFIKAMNKPGSLKSQQRLGFQVSPPANMGMEQGLKAMLENVEDLLFVLDEQGRIINCKARSGEVSNTYPMFGDLNIQDILPPTVKRKFNLALEQYHRSQHFTVFESMLTLPPNAANWYEFRLIPALKRQMVLFIWNVNAYRAPSWTISNLPIALDKMVEGWLRSLYLRDFETEGHTRRVTETTIALAHRLNFTEEDLLNIRRGAQVHDIGKIAIPDEILLKTDKLSEEEWQIMRQHPLIAVEMLKAFPNMEPMLAIPRSHHEKWDGSGYPDGLAGEAIPLAARIFAFADVYDALTSDRPYRRAWAQEDALQYIQNEAGRHFDPLLMPEFIRLMKE